MLSVEEKFEASLKASGGDENIEARPVTNTSKVSTKVLADGTYASEICDDYSNATASETGRQLPNIKSKKPQYFS